MAKKKAAKKKAAKKKAAKKKKEISPEEYKQFLEALVIDDVVLIRSQSEFCTGVERLGQGHQIELEIQERKSIEETDRKHIILGSHRLEVKGHSRIDNEDVELFKILCEFACVFIAETSFGKDALNKFRDHNLHLLTIPFIREFIRAITTKMGLPPLVLPLTKPTK